MSSHGSNKNYQLSSSWLGPKTRMKVRRIDLDSVLEFDANDKVCMSIPTLFLDRILQTKKDFI